jgi:UrcA family protein
MKIRSTNCWQLAGLALAVLSAPLAAQGTDDGTVVNAPRYQETVGFGDLDLRLTDDQHVLITRVKHASKRVCLNMAHDGAIDVGDAFFCRTATYRAARPQIRRAFANAEAGQQVAFKLTVGANKKKT